MPRPGVLGGISCQGMTLAAGSYPELDMMVAASAHQHALSGRRGTPCLLAASKHIESADRA